MEREMTNQGDVPRKGAAAGANTTAPAARPTSGPTYAQAIKGLLFFLIGTGGAGIYAGALYALSVSGFDTGVRFIHSLGF